MLNLKAILKFVFFSLLILAGYSLFSSAIGGLHANTKQIYTEFPLCLIFSGFVYLSLKPSKYRMLLAYMPIFVFYLGIDIYYILFGEVFRFVSFEEAPELLMLFNVLEHSFMLLSALILIFVFFRHVNKAKSYFLIAAVLFITTLTLIATYFPATYIFAFESLSREIVNTRADRNVKYNGKLSTLFYEEAKRHQTISRLSGIDTTKMVKVGKKRAEFLKENLQRPIFIFQLESFLDPTELKRLDLGKSFNNPFFERISSAKGYVTSPVFGGHTAQAEFEVLCSAPALAKFSDIEFNGFTGEKSDCIANWVSMAGFPTTVNFAYSPSYFNALKAYRSLGFQQLRYPKKYSTQQAYPLDQALCGRETLMRDKALFEQSLAYYLNQKQRVSLTYSMGMFGHWPHKIDRDCHPDYLSLGEGYKGKALERAVNQYRYRTQSIAEFIPQLFEAVPDALVLIISDHLPPMTDKKDVYSSLQYHGEKQRHPKTNVFYVFDAGRALDMSTVKNIHHYQMSDLLFDLATDGKWCRKFQCVLEKKPSTPSLYQRYLSIIKLASQ